MKKIQLATLPVSCFAAVLSVTPAFAQAANDSEGMGDIVVTASKRETSLQSTPIAMNAFDQSMLAANGANDLRSLQNIAPTLQIGMSGTNTLLTIRGISSRDFTEIGDPAVAVSTDNFYIQRAAALNASVFDVERVEVLRGPQGTLYGRNATAGAINISSVKPVLGDVTGFGSLEYGSYNALRAEGAINLPLGDTVAVRASFLSSSRDGYSTNPGVPRNGDDEDTKGARVHVLFKPTDRFSVLVTGEYTKVGGVGPVVYGQPFTFTAPGVVNHGEIPLVTRNNWALNTPGSLNIETKSLRGQISYDFDFATLTYLGGYRKFIYNRINDTDGTAINSNATYLTFPQNENEDSQNHELRLTSPDNQAFTWQGGLYYFKERNDLLSFFGYSNTVPITLLRTFSYNVGAESKAAFGQVGYRLSDQFQVEAGIRYSEDLKTRVGYNIVNGVRTDQNSRTSAGQVTWHVGVNAQLTPRNLIYAKVDTGYKSGGFTDLNEYGAEFVTAYEVGTKNRFFDGTLQVNLTAFFYDYKDLQVSQVRDDARTVILNAGRSEIYGAELETIFEPSRNDRLDFSANYLNARYKNFAVAVGGVNVSYAGNPMIQSPDWSLTGGYQHTFEVGGADIVARVQSHYQTRSFFSYRNYVSESEGPFTKTDLTLTYRPTEAKWDLLLYLRNIEDRRVITDVSEYATSGVYRLQFAEPRTYGARLTYRF